MARKREVDGAKGDQEARSSCSCKVEEGAKFWRPAAAEEKGGRKVALAESV